MSRYIDADKLHYKKIYISSGYEDTKPAVVVFAKEIDKFKKADVDLENVVRCKDCIHYNYTFNQVYRERPRCEFHHYDYVTENGFCSHGEKGEAKEQ